MQSFIIDIFNLFSKIPSFLRSFSFFSEIDFSDACLLKDSNYQGIMVYLFMFIIPYVVWFCILT